MPYKISGTLTDGARVIIIEESDWSISSSTVETSGSFVIDELDESGDKLVIARRTSDGWGLGYGSVTPEYYAPLARGLFAGGNISNVIDYVTIATTGNATDFGDLQTGKRMFNAVSNGTNNRGIFPGGNTSGGSTNEIDYVSCDTPANAADFGNMFWNVNGFGAASNATSEKGWFAGGYLNDSGGTDWCHWLNIASLGNATYGGKLSAYRWNLCATDNGTNDRGVTGGGFNGSHSNVMDYVTISTGSGATDFGDLHAQLYDGTATSNRTGNRGIFQGGWQSGDANRIDYITISSTGNASDFGDMISAVGRGGGCSNGTNNRGLFAVAMGSVTNTIQYVTISTLGNAVDFGDLTQARGEGAACANA